MVGHGVHSAVFGFTFGAYVCSIVPVLKVMGINMSFYGFLWTSPLEKMQTIFDICFCIKVISKEVTVSLGLCLFTFAIASLVGPLAVSNCHH